MLASLFYVAIHILTKVMKLWVFLEQLLFISEKQITVVQRVCPSILSYHSFGACDKHCFRYSLLYYITDSITVQI